MTEIKKESDLKDLSAIKKIAQDAWKSARDRVRVQDLDPFDKGRVFQHLDKLIRDYIDSDCTFKKNPSDMSEACCGDWMSSKDQLSHYWTDFRYCPFCNAEFK